MCSLPIQVQIQWLGSNRRGPDASCQNSTNFYHRFFHLQTGTTDYIQENVARTFANPFSSRLSETVINEVYFIHY